MSTMIIDGAQGEGGGQILRTSLSLSALTGRPLLLENIRAGRSRPGLRPQHLTAVRAVAAICNAQLEGDHLDSQRLRFTPAHAPRGGAYRFDVSDAAETFSAGSITLIWQALLWPLCFADEPATLGLRGGTFVPFSPPYHYLAHVALPAFACFGTRASSELRLWGWMQQGAGEIVCHIEPVAGLDAAGWQARDSHPVEEIGGVAAVTNLPAHIPQRMANRAANALAERDLRANIQVIRERGAGAGAGICLWLPPGGDRMGGFSALGRQGLPADQVADEAVARLLAFMDNQAIVDPFLADQLLLPMALSAGHSRFTTSRLTGHLLTQASLLQGWLDAEIEIKGEKDLPGEVMVRGMGFQRSSS